MKKNKIFALSLAILLVLPLCFLASCKQNPDILPNARFVAKVTEVKEGQLFVTVIDKGNSSLGNGTPVYVSTNFAELGSQKLNGNTEPNPEPNPEQP
jgi:hypothetical protein